jgi:hypothetical protein
MFSTFFGKVPEIGDKTICKVWLKTCHLEIPQKSIFVGLHWALSF